jgi:hypothetical protein
MRYRSIWCFPGEEVVGGVFGTFAPLQVLAKARVSYPAII